MATMVLAGGAAVERIGGDGPEDNALQHRRRLTKYAPRGLSTVARPDMFRDRQ